MRRHSATPSCARCVAAKECGYKCPVYSTAETSRCFRAGGLNKSVGFCLHYGSLSYRCSTFISIESEKGVVHTDSCSRSTIGDIKVFSQHRGAANCEFVTAPRCTCGYGRLSAACNDVSCVIEIVSRYRARF